MSIYDTLNPEQYEAVRHDKGPLLLLAGAGSGKTRVLTHRIAYLIQERGVKPWNILAITFTNKAASEMRERVDQIVDEGAEDVWVSTFHSTCVRILRRYIDTIGYERNFTIYDTDDQRTLMRDICKYLDIDTKRLKERAILSEISKAKDELITPESYERSAAGDYYKKIYAKAYVEYQKRLKKNNAMDFDDLIVKTIELFEANNEALTYFQNRFKYIMVDEYQDTNTAQFRLIELLASGVNEEGNKEYNLCVVGDDDQSIYKFRGANIENILNFEKAFPSARTIKLEQNYRSTKSILNVANEVIKNNTERKDKALWTDNEEGHPVSFTQYDNGYEEADGITSEISQMVRNQEASYNDFAILYRTNAQSRLFEEKLIMRNIPYQIIGGTNFYARKEVKDIIAYLKTIDNGQDDISVKRIVNVPRRGIGLTTIDRVTNYSLTNDMSFYEALTRAQSIPGLERTASRITPFVSLIEGIKEKTFHENYDIKEIINDILEATGYLRELKEDGSEEALDRIDNINELISKLESYADGADEPSLSGFLEEIALVADIDNLDENAEHIVLMTLHSAKGLEFPYVYLTGMEDGLFPSYMALSADNPEEELQEERRLCYVGITRAERKLSLTSAKERFIRGEHRFNSPSRFINEIPRYLLTKNVPENTRKTISFDSYKKPTINRPTIRKPRDFGQATLASLDYEVGDMVKHQKFGLGKVSNIVKGGKDYEVTVDFDKFGTKKLLSTFAKLTKAN